MNTIEFRKLLKEHFKPRLSELGFKGLQATSRSVRLRLTPYSLIGPFAS